ncbi:Zinc finger, CCHC-type [Gossypium australe]|uniref:Zinc finger, CCHC-type n=1 Tax=Gossypium australe TaxID=47621 RepID=A0A5B6WNE5_9ROSI|nr:Zinc finger, CCHC-type [Gossypium australe]
MDSIMQKHKWKLVDLLLGIRPLNSKWIFKQKMKADGAIDKYKARLVIKVSIITSIRMILTIATLRNLEVHQMDVKTAFLNEDLDEEIYMEQLEGHVVLGQEMKVCKLVKSLYGLKQGPKQWHEKFNNVMMTNGFNNKKKVKRTKDILNSRFHMKYMRLADVISGI